MASAKAMLVFVHIFIILQKGGDMFGYYSFKRFDYMGGQGNWSIVLRQTPGTTLENRSDLSALQWNRNLTAIKGRPIKDYSGRDSAVAQFFRRMAGIWSAPATQ